MVVGKKEKTDVKYDREAVIMIRGQRYEQPVYGDKKFPDRRDSFAPNLSVRLPEKTKVKWMGKMYNAKLSFRYGRGGSKIPVYTWSVR